MIDESHKWTILGMNDEECYVEINGMEYRVSKQSACVVHSIMCLVDTMEEIVRQLSDIERSISRNK